MLRLAIQSKWDEASSRRLSPDLPAHRRRLLGVAAEVPIRGGASFNQSRGMRRSPSSGKRGPVFPGGVEKSMTVCEPGSWQGSRY